MTGATGFIPWSFGGEARSSETKTESVAQTAQQNDNGENAHPDAFELIELHSRWFGESNDQAAVAAAESKMPETTVVNNALVRKQGPVVYRIIKSDQTAAKEAPDTGQAEPQESRHESIAETLARAEQVLQQLPDLPHQPQHSRLQTSLSALEAALSGTTLSALETALAGREMPAKKEAS
ncbi:MAG TPA: hypothetical protein VKA94_15095 [Hyphomicrobiales bacterium]|nr:hypothetical protein [Hyphomicrobiales bacterium]